jgi:hypothetical protein
VTDRCQACGNPAEMLIRLPETPRAPSRLALVCSGCNARLMLYAPILRYYAASEAAAARALTTKEVPCRVL